MQKIKAILFDIDNTLFDIKDIKKNAIASAAQAMLDAGLKIEKDEIIRLLEKEYFDEPKFYGRTVISDFLQEQAIHDPKIEAAGIEGYRKGKIPHMKPYRGVVETLKALKGLNCALAIVSDAREVKVHQNLYALGIDHFFEVVISSRTLNTFKPDKIAFAAALEALGVTPEETVHVGDNIDRDVQGANNIGMHSVYAVYGECHSEGIYEGKADFEINNFSEILGVVESLNQKA